MVLMSEESAQTRRFVMNPILIDGVLSTEKLRFTIEEIVRANRENWALSLVVAAEGEDILPALVFVDSLLFSKNLYTINAWNIKVYEASGTAAFIVALLGANGAKISMRAGTSLGFSSGRVSVGPLDMTPTGEINDGLLQTFGRYNNLLFDAMASFGFNKSCLGLPILGPQTFSVPAQECLDRGIVQKLF